MKSRMMPYMTVCGVLLIAILVCAFTTRERFDRQYPVKTELPENIGSYLGFNIYHCQSEACQKSFRARDLIESGVCPECGGKLETVSLAEHQLLPKDTTILHRSYKSLSGLEFNVSVVIGGHERRSIHKPQVCIVGQGNTITGQHPIRVPVGEGRELDVMLMEINRSKLYFAYWFTDGKTETARHLTRLFRTAWDGIVHNKRRRWAYISISVVNARGADSLPELKRFISLLYRVISCGNSLSQ